MSRFAIAQSLYTRIGGYDVIAAFVDNWFALASPGTSLEVRHAGMTPACRSEARQLLVDCLAAHAGGPVVYAGPAATEIFSAAGLSPAEWAELLRHARIALDGLGVAADARDGVLALLAGRGRA